MIAIYRWLMGCWLWGVGGIVAAGGLAPAATAAADEFEIRLDVAEQQPRSGRVLVFTSALRNSPGEPTARQAEPRFGPNWFRPEPFFAVDVVDFVTGSTARVDAHAAGYPAALDQLARGRYRVQAVFSQSEESPHPGRAAGNCYSDVVELTFDPAGREVHRLALRNTAVAEPFPTTDWLHEVRLPSRLLTEFGGRGSPPRPVEHVCAVVLPASYHAEPQRRYPVIYSIPGFGGSHREALKYRHQPPTAGPGEVEFIRVMLNGNCGWGHHVFADSETNGPRGTAFVDELIPQLDARYRTVADAQARFLTGHSSGGWASLWLQVNWAERFGGVWSTAPDPVDFRDFQAIDLYARPTANMFFDSRGQPRPLARRQGQPALWYQYFSRMDDVLGRGGQLRSFEAVFSPRGEDGLPRRLWNRQSGQIDPEVAEAWKRYDLNLVLRDRWPTLGPGLAGKLHVYMGDADTYYLDGAVRRLQATLSELGSDAEIVFLPGRDHTSLLTTDLFAQVRRQMSAQFRRGAEQPVVRVKNLSPEPKASLAPRASPGPS